MAGELIKTNFELPKWDAKKITGVLLSIALLGAVAYGLVFYVLPMIFAIASELLKYAIIGIFGIFSLLLFTNKKFWRGIKYFSEAFAQATLGWAIEMNPWAILENQIDEAEKDREKLAEQAAKLKGIQAEISGQLEKYNRIMNESNNQVRAGQDKLAQDPTNSGLENAIESAYNNYTNAKDYVDSVSPIMNDMNGLVTYADKAYDKTGNMLKNSRTTLQIQKDKYKAVTGGSSAMAAAMRAFGGNTDLNNDADKALGFIRADVAAKIGLIKNNIRITTQFMNTEDLKDAGKVRAAKEAMKTLDAVPVTSMPFSPERSAMKLPASVGDKSNGYMDLLAKPAKETN